QALANNCPQPRDVQPPALGRVVAIPQVGGLHHVYLGFPERLFGWPYRGQAKGPARFPLMRRPRAEGTIEDVLGHQTRRFGNPPCTVKYAGPRRDRSPTVMEATSC